MKPITLLATSVLVIISIQGCAVNKGFAPTATSHADGTVKENFLFSQHNGAVCVGIGYRAFQECYGYGTPEEKPSIPSKRSISKIEILPVQDKNIQPKKPPKKSTAQATIRSPKKEVAQAAVVIPQPSHVPVNHPLTLSSGSAAPVCRLDSETSEKAIPKVLIAIGANSIAEGQKNEKGLWAAVVHTGGKFIRNKEIESALKDICPGLDELGIRTVSRVISLYIDKDLTPEKFAHETIKEEIIERIKEKDPQLGASAEVTDFVYSVIKAKSEQ